MRRMADEARSGGAELIVFPEGGMVHFGGPTEPLVPVAEQLDGAFVTELSRIARDHQLVVVSGMFEPADARRVYNTVVAIGSNGELLGHYRKIHLYDAFGYRESDRIMPGSGQTLCVEAGGLKFGVMTCYDVRFPELARVLLDQQIDAILLPAAWLHGLLKEDHWEVLVRARAIENTVYVVACDQVKRGYSGASMVVDPLGVVRARAGEEVELLIADLAAERVKEARLKVPSLSHRRIAVRFDDERAPAPSTPRC
jgi:predicted amidohydrolase